MKIFLAACLLTITFLSHGWGKHYLVETGDANEDDNDATDKVKLDITRTDVETMMKSILKSDRFKSLPAKKQKKIMNRINKIIDGKENMDYWFGSRFEEKSFSRLVRNNRDPCHDADYYIQCCVNILFFSHP